MLSQKSLILVLNQCKIIICIYLLKYISVLFSVYCLVQSSSIHPVDNLRRLPNNDQRGKETPRDLVTSFTPITAITNVWSTKITLYSITASVYGFYCTYEQCTIAYLHTMYSHMLSKCPIVKFSLNYTNLPWFSFNLKRSPNKSSHNYVKVIINI